MTPRRRFPACPRALTPPPSAALRRRPLQFGLAAALGASLAAGCGSDGSGPGGDGPAPPGGQTGEESFGCQPVERDTLAWSERSPLGFSADELLNVVGSEIEARLAWSSGGGTPLTLGIERAASGSVELQRRDYVSDGSGAEPAAELAVTCNDVVSIPIVLSFVTADGAFAERWPLTLLAESTARASAYTQVDVDELEGSFSVTQVDAGRFDQVLAVVQLGFADGDWTGTLSGQGITQSSSGPDGTTSATLFAIGSF